ncbi:MAG: replication-associated recombination protein A [Candidatus Kapabacteria bacterium]|nr:replication-associated recombination protein A [Candidatus Kapabacteria bacterium]
METLFDSEETSENGNLSATKERHNPSVPLAERMRPQTFDEVLGQEHLVSKGAPIRVFAEKGLIPSMILWGAPGIGKTTLALIIAQSVKADFVRLSAVEAGVKDVREVLAKAEKRHQRNLATVLFIDEIHRFNKNQQDALLHAVEQGIITLIGATTENPSFEVNPALLSRCRVYTLQSLTEEHTETLVQRALRRLSEDLDKRVLLDDTETLAPLLHRLTGGDARGILNVLESASNLVLGQSSLDASEDIILSQTSIEAALQQKTPRYDKKGEGHYDTISAFIKSLRGSDPDAALFWLAVMLEAGEDARFIARRMVIFASEDIGNASPMALQLALAVFQAVDVIGMPECRINLAQGVTFLASCPKSNASYVAVEAALRDVRSGADTRVPLHLRNAPTKLMKQEGYGREYKYPHDFPNHFVEENYFPDHERVFYRPTAMGKEQDLKRRLEHLRPNRYDGASE